MNAGTDPQTGNFSYIGLQYYSLTWCCHESQALFEQRDRVDLVRVQLLRALAETNVVNIAYCFMPDHLHQVVKGRSADADAKAYISKAKQYSGYYFAQTFHTRLWARKGFNRVLAPDEDPRTAVKYVLGNPLKANLVARIEDHPFSGSETHTWQELIDWAYNRSHDDGSN